MPQGTPSDLWTWKQGVCYSFFNKPIEHVYYVDKVVKKEFDIDFLLLFENHKLLNFINLHMKFNLNHFKASYCCIGASSICIFCQFRGRLIKFCIEDFKNVLELEYKGMEICVSNAPNFNHTVCQDDLWDIC